MVFKDLDKQREAQRNYKKRTKAWFIDLKKTLSCQRCGFSHHAAMHFHHKDDKTKAFGVSEMVNKKFSIENVMIEIAKCDVLCANCHAILHFENGYSGGRPRTKD